MNRRSSLVAVVVSLGILGFGVSGAPAQGLATADPATFGLYGPAPPNTPVTVAYGPTIISGSVYSPGATDTPVPTYQTASYSASYPTPSYTASYPAATYAASYAAPAYPVSYTTASYPVSTVAYRPVAPQYWAPQCVRPVAAYRPVVTPPVMAASYLRPYPYTAYSPVVYTAYNAPAYSAPAAVASGPRMIVKPKVVWIEGQPIRNLLRAITP